MCACENMFRILVERTPTAVILYQDERVIFVNTSMQELTGYKREEILKMHFWDFAHPEDRELIRSRGLARQQGHPIPNHYGFKILNKTGQTKWVDFAGQTINITGKPAGFAILREVSPWAISKGTLRAIFDQACDGIVLLDRQGWIVSWNAGMEGITGLSSKEVIGRKAQAIAALLAPKNRAERIKFLGSMHLAGPTFRLQNGEKSSLLEFRIERPDRSSRVVQLSLFPVQIKDGRMFAAIARDLTEYREVEKSFTEAGQRYQSLFENTVEGIFQTTPSGRFLSVNPSFARMLGYDTEQELLTSVTDIARDLHTDPGERDDFLKKLKEQGIVRNHEVRYRHKDGPGIWVSINAKAALSSDGSIVFIDGFVQDISERKRLEQQLIQSQKMEAVGRLAGGIAHDFNNVLTVMMGNCELLQETFRKGDRGLEELNGISKGVTFAAALTRRLLAFSRQQVLSPRILNLNSVIQGVELMLERLIGENIRLSMALDPRLGRLKADPSQLEQVIMNLAVNARDAMPNGGQLTFSTTNLLINDMGRYTEPDLKPGKYILLRVSDTGLGMSQATLDHLFEPFFTTKELGHGTGLGLSTVYGIVRQSGGTISVTSTPGRGHASPLSCHRLKMTCLQYLRFPAKKFAVDLELSWLWKMMQPSES